MWARDAKTKKSFVNVAPSSHLWEADLPDDLGVGVHTLSVRAVDEFGRTHHAAFGAGDHGAMTVLEMVDPKSLGFSQPRLLRVSDWLQQQVDSERLAGASVLISRKGKTAFAEAVGLADLEEDRAFELDTVVRIYSMTKAITTVAAMMLYERGAFQLDDPVARFLPEFKDTSVWQGGSASLTPRR